MYTPLDARSDTVSTATLGADAAIVWDDAMCEEDSSPRRPIRMKLMEKENEGGEREWAQRMGGLKKGCGENR